MQWFARTIVVLSQYCPALNLIFAPRAFLSLGHGGSVVTAWDETRELGHQDVKPRHRSDGIIEEHGKNGSHQSSHIKHYTSLLI